MPFKSDKQRRFLWSQKPEVAKQIAYKQLGGPLADFDSWTDVEPEKQTHQAAINAALDFTPVLGDIKAFKEAETPLDYGLATAGLVPGLGDLAPIAKPLLGVTPLFGKLPKDFNLSKHQLQNAQRDFGISPDDPEYAKIVADMERQFADPSLAIEDPTRIALRGGDDPLSYASYKTPDGKWIHGTYGDKTGRFRNTLGGTKKKPSEGKETSVALGPLAQVKRPGKDFRVSTEGSAGGRSDSYYETLGDALKPKTTQVQGVEGGKALSRARSGEKLSAKQQEQLTAMKNKALEADDVDLWEELEALGFNRGGRVGPLGRCK